MLPIRAVLFLPILFMSAIAEDVGATPVAGYSREYLDCMKHASGDVEMTECEGREVERIDKRIQSLFEKLKKMSDRDAAAALDSAQKQWVLYRKAQCFYEFQQAGGTLGHVVGTACELKMALERIVALDHFVTLERAQIAVPVRVRKR